MKQLRVRQEGNFEEIWIERAPAGEALFQRKMAEEP
jgi:hypothetical protein